GARVSRHGLRPGDVVELGPARISFRQEPESPKGKHVKFASQLKGFAPFGEGEDAGGRTILGMSGSGPGLVLEQGDYSDRMPAGEAQFDLGTGPETPTAAVVDLDPVLDSGLEELEIASFEDEELTALEGKEDAPPVRARPAPQRAAHAAPAPPAPRSAPAPAPRPAPRVEAAPPEPVAAAPRAQPRSVAPAAAAVAEPSGDTSAPATRSLELA